MPYDSASRKQNEVDMEDFNEQLSFEKCILNV